VQRGMLVVSWQSPQGEMERKGAGERTGAMSQSSLLENRGESEPMQGALWQMQTVLVGHARRHVRHSSRQQALVRRCRAKRTQHTDGEKGACGRHRVCSAVKWARRQGKKA